MPQRTVVDGKVKAGRVVATAVGELLQQTVPGVEQLRVHHGPNMHRGNGPVREVSGRVQYGFWAPHRNTHRRTPEPILQNSVLLL